METTLEKLLEITKSAMHNDPASAEKLKLIGEVLVLVGGVDALCDLQGQLHDYAVEEWPRVVGQGFGFYK